MGRSKVGARSLYTEREVGLNRGWPEIEARGSAQRVGTHASPEIEARGSAQRVGTHASPEIEARGSARVVNTFRARASAHLSEAAA